MTRTLAFSCASWDGKALLPHVVASWVCPSDPLPVSSLSLQSVMSSQELPLGRSERLGSISDSVAKLFSLSKEKGQSPSRLALRDRLEEPETLLESAYSQPNIAKGLLLGENITVEDGRHSLSFTKLQQAEKRRIDLQSSGPARERRTRQTPSSSGISLGAHHASQILLRAKSLLQSPERENIAFQQYSLPSETAVRPSVIPLLPLNQEYPSLAEFRTLKTIGELSLWLERYFLPCPPPLIHCISLSELALHGIVSKLDRHSFDPATKCKLLEASNNDMTTSALQPPKHSKAKHL